MSDRNETGFSLDDLLGGPQAGPLEPEPEPAPEPDPEPSATASSDEAEALLRAMGLLMEEPAFEELRDPEPAPPDPAPDPAEDLLSLLGIDLGLDAIAAAPASDPAPVEEEPPRASVRSRFADAPAFQSVREIAPAVQPVVPQPVPAPEEEPCTEAEPAEPQEAQKKPEPEPERVREPLAIQPAKLLPEPARPKQMEPAAGERPQSEPEPASAPALALEPEPALEPAPAPEPRPTSAASEEPLSPPETQPAPAPELEPVPEPLVVAAPPRPAPEPARASAPAPDPVPECEPEPALEPAPVPASAPARPFKMPQGRDVSHAKPKRGSGLWYAAGVALLVLAAACTWYSVCASTASAASLHAGADAKPNAASAEPASMTFEYTVQGPKDALYEATEVAQFDADGLLDCSTIAVAVESDEEAETFLAHARDQFGSAWVGGSAKEGRVEFTIDAERDGVDREAYARLLASNTTDCVVVDPAS